MSSAVASPHAASVPLPAGSSADLPQSSSTSAGRLGGGFARKAREQPARSNVERAYIEPSGSQTRSRTLLSDTYLNGHSPSGISPEKSANLSRKPSPSSTASSSGGLASERKREKRQVGGGSLDVALRDVSTSSAAPAMSQQGRSDPGRRSRSSDNSSDSLKETIIADERGSGVAPAMAQAAAARQPSPPALAKRPRPRYAPLSNYEKKWRAQALANAKQDTPPAPVKRRSGRASVPSSYHEASSGDSEPETRGATLYREDGKPGGPSMTPSAPASAAGDAQGSTSPSAGPNTGRPKARVIRLRFVHKSSSTPTDAKDSEVLPPSQAEEMPSEGSLDGTPTVMKAESSKKVLKSFADADQPSSASAAHSDTGIHKQPDGIVDDEWMSPLAVLGIATRTTSTRTVPQEVQQVPASDAQATAAATVPIQDAPTSAASPAQNNATTSLSTSDRSRKRSREASEPLTEPEDEADGVAPVNNVKAGGIATDRAAAARRAPRKKRKWLKKGQVDPDDPIAVRRQKERHTLIDQALEDLDRQYRKVQQDKHPQLTAMWHELDRRRDVLMDRCEARYHAILNELSWVANNEDQANIETWEENLLEVREDLNRRYDNNLVALDRQERQCNHRPEKLKALRDGHGTGGWQMYDQHLLHKKTIPLVPTFLGGVVRERKDYSVRPVMLDPTALLGDLAVYNVRQAGPPRHSKAGQTAEKIAPPVQSAAAAYAASQEAKKAERDRLQAIRSGPAAAKAADAPPPRTTPVILAPYPAPAPKKAGPDKTKQAIKASPATAMQHDKQQAIKAGPATATQHDKQQAIMADPTAATPADAPPTKPMPPVSASNTAQASGTAENDKHKQAITASPVAAAQHDKQQAIKAGPTAASLAVIGSANARLPVPASNAAGLPKVPDDDKHEGAVAGSPTAAKPTGSQPTTFRLYSSYNISQITQAQNLLKEREEMAKSREEMEAEIVRNKQEMTANWVERARLDAKRLDADREAAREAARLKPLRPRAKPKRQPKKSAPEATAAESASKPPQATPQAAQDSSASVALKPTATPATAAPAQIPDSAQVASEPVSTPAANNAAKESTTPAATTTAVADKTSEKPVAAASTSAPAPAAAAPASTQPVSSQPAIAPPKAAPAATANTANPSVGAASNPSGRESPSSNIWRYHPNGGPPHTKESAAEANKAFKEPPPENEKVDYTLKEARGFGKDQGNGAKASPAETDTPRLDREIRNVGSRWHAPLPVGAARPPTLQTPKSAFAAPAFAKAAPTPASVKTPASAADASTPGSSITPVARPGTFTPSGGFALYAKGSSGELKTTMSQSPSQSPGGASTSLPAANSVSQSAFAAPASASASGSKITPSISADSLPEAEPGNPSSPSGPRIPPAVVFEDGSAAAKFVPGKGSTLTQEDFRPTIFANGRTPPSPPALAPWVIAGRLKEKKQPPTISGGAKSAAATIAGASAAAKSASASRP